MTDDVTRTNARVLNPDGSIAWELVQDGDEDDEPPYGVTD